MTVPDRHRFAVEADAQGFSLRFDGATLATVARAHPAIRVEPSALAQFPVVDILRWSAALVAALQGCPWLHAAAARCEQGTLAAIAPGGTGKSTLIAALCHAGWTPVSDDALCCDRNGRVDIGAERRLRTWCAEHAARAATGAAIDAGDMFRPALPATAAADSVQLDAILFLSTPRRTDGRFAAARAAPADAFALLVQRGLGTPPTPAAWRTEASLYRDLASRIACWNVHAPEGVDVMAACAPAAMLDLLHRSRAAAPVPASAA